MTDVWAYADCKGSELLVLLALADFSDDNGENIYPSMTTLAKKARLSESQARRVVQNLVKLGLLEIIEEGGWNGGRNLSNSYRILVEGLRERGSNLTPPPLHPRDHGGSTGARDVVAPTRDDPSSKHLSKPPLEKKRPSTGRKQSRSYTDPPPDAPRRKYSL